MSSYTKDRVSDILYNDSPSLLESYCIVIDADKHSPLVGYCYEHDATTRSTVQDNLIDLYCGRILGFHGCMFIAESVVLAAIWVYTIYQYGVLAGVGSVLLVVGALGALYLAHVTMFKRDVFQTVASIRQACVTYRQCQSDSLFRKLDSRIEIGILDGRRILFSILACKEVYEQWNKIDGEGEPMERARAEMSDCIIETAYNILQATYQVPLYDDASNKVQQDFRDKLHKGYVVPLIRDLASIAEDFKAACQKHDQAKKEEIRQRMEAVVEEMRRQGQLDEASRQATREFADEQVRQAMNGPL